ncbi:MAG TPA: hypothetical protein VL728_05480 [Cyclobacteriaceae bacterium]|jgi:hypothetical protein|nr:hypothetical protein [Cyclobacteriaceae bacterium]
MATRKITCVLALTLALSQFTHAQDYKKFKAGVGVGYAAASGFGSAGGMLITIEPAYRVHDDFSVGLRLEGAGIIRGTSVDVTSFGSNFAPDRTVISSYTINGQYYFGTPEFRPFLGAGFGIYEYGLYELGVQTVFGFYPRIGFDIGHLNFTFDYNFVPAVSFFGAPAELQNNYFGMRVGTFFGGGKK